MTNPILNRTFFDHHNGKTCNPVFEHSFLKDQIWLSSYVHFFYEIQKK